MARERRGVLAEPMPSRPATAPPGPAPPQPALPLAGAASLSGETLDFSAYVGEGAAVVGTVSLAGNARVDGRVDGDILGARVLVLGPTARVRGTLSAESVLVLGAEVEADITAKRTIELRDGAKVKGALSARDVHMDPDIEFSGTCHLHPKGD